MWPASSGSTQRAERHRRAPGQVSPMSCGESSRFDCPALEREHAAWAPLNEQDQQDQHDNLAEDSAGERFEELVHDAQGQGAYHSAPKIAYATEHDDHETVDDVALAEVGGDVVDLAQRHACHAS